MLDKVFLLFGQCRSFNLYFLISNNIGNAKKDIDMDGCFINYRAAPRKPPTSYREIVDYVKEFHNTPDRFEVGINRGNKDIWGTDQNMVSIRMRQFALRHGAERVKMQYETRAHQRLDRGEPTWWNKIDMDGIDRLKDSHFLQTTY